MKEYVSSFVKYFSSFILFPPDNFPITKEVMSYPLGITTKCKIQRKKTRCKIKKIQQTSCMCEIADWGYHINQKFHEDHLSFFLSLLGSYKFTTKLTPKGCLIYIKASQYGRPDFFPGSCSDVQLIYVH